MESNPNPINLTVELLRNYMRLARSQVVLYNQGWKIPPDQDLYISVGLLNERPYGSSCSYHHNEDHTALLETVQLNVQEVYSINAYSFGPEALNRKDELVMAFHSTMAQQLQEKHGFKYANIPVAFTDTSYAEGAARLNRYTLTINALCARRKTTVVQYYDKFSNEALIINP